MNHKSYQCNVWYLLIWQCFGKELNMYLYSNIFNRSFCVHKYFCWAGLTLNFKKEIKVGILLKNMTLTLLLKEIMLLKYIIQTNGFSVFFMIDSRSSCWLLKVVDVNAATTRTTKHYVNTLWIIVVVLRHTAAHFLKRLKRNNLSVKECSCITY